MPSLEMFNFERADEYRKQVMEEDKKGGKEVTKKGDKKKGAGGTKGKSKIDKA